MTVSAGPASPQLTVVYFTIFFGFSTSSDCISYRTNTLGEYKYPMEELQDGITSFQFSVNVMKFAYITLSPVARDTSDQYEIAIGNSDMANTAAIRRCRHCEDRQSVRTDYRLLTFNEFKLFWVKFKSGTIEIGRYNETALLSWTDSYPLDIRYIGIATGVGLSGDFIFCDDRFQNRNDISMDGMFGLFVFFLPPTVILVRFLWRKLSQHFNKSVSSDDETTESNGGFVTTRGIYNPTWTADPNPPPSYEKCMEDGEGLRSVERGASTSSDCSSELPPSYESVMANCLFKWNGDGQPHVSQQRNGVSCTLDGIIYGDEETCV